MSCTRDADGPVVAEGSQEWILRKVQIPWWPIDLGDDSECIVRFSTKCGMATHSMAKRQHFGTFCLSLLYNCLALVYWSFESGALIAYSTKVHQYHGWLLDRDGTSIFHFDTGI